MSMFIMRSDCALCVMFNPEASKILHSMAHTLVWTHNPIFLSIGISMSILSILCYILSSACHLKMFSLVWALYALLSRAMFVTWFCHTSVFVTLSQCLSQCLSNVFVTVSFDSLSCKARSFLANGSCTDLHESSKIL